MALIFEDSHKVTRRKAPIPERDRKYYSALYNALEPTVGKNNLKNLKSLGSTKKYNKKGADSKMNGDDQNLNYVSVEDAKKRMERMNPNDITQGGQKAYDFYKRTIQRARSQEKISPVEPPKPTSNAVKAPEIEKPTTIDKPGGTITVAENKLINENEIYYEYMEDYGVYYVLSEFFNNPQGKQNWGTLINPDMYVKALREFTQYGKLVKFPSKYVYQWMGIIMRNTATLEANTDLAGHSMNFPFEEVHDFAEREGVELSDDYGECADWLEEKGLYDWMQMPDGSDAWSDFGIKPLWEIIEEYDESLPPEKVLILVNRALDVAHCRGDLSSIFIQGGRNTLSKISEEIKRSGKKIYLSEQSLKKLYEYYTQLNLPFNDTTGKGYDDKQNYEHFIDWMEYVGKYGTLPSSNINEQELSSIIEANIPNAFNNFLDSDLEDYNYLDGLSSAIKYIYSMCEDSDDLRIFFNMPEEFYEDPPYDIIEFIEENDIDRDDIDELKKLLTDEGIEEFNKYMRQHFIDSYTDNGIPNSLTIDNRGLIYIEREITTPNVLLTNMPDNMDMKNYFEYLRSSFNGLGNCWTWKQGRGEAYCGNYYGNNDYILLQGWVDPKSINWEETLVRNAWSLNEECEIFINDGQIVEVDKITINNASNGNYGKNILNRPMLIQT